MTSPHAISSTTRSLPQRNEHRPSRLARFIVRGQMGARRETELARLTGARR